MAASWTHSSPRASLPPPARPRAKQTRLEGGVEAPRRTRAAAVRACAGCGAWPSPSRQGGGVGVDRLAVDEHRHVEQPRSSGATIAASMAGSASARCSAPSFSSTSVPIAARLGVRDARSARRSCCGTRRPRRAPGRRSVRTRVRSAMMNADRKPSPNRPIRSSSARLLARLARVAGADRGQEARRSRRGSCPRRRRARSATRSPGRPELDRARPRTPGPRSGGAMIESCAFWTSSRTATAGVEYRCEPRTVISPPRSTCVAWRSVATDLPDSLLCGQ